MRRRRGRTRPRREVIKVKTLNYRNESNGKVYTEISLTPYDLVNIARQELLLTEGICEDGHTIIIKIRFEVVE